MIFTINSMIRYLVSLDRGEASGMGLLGFFLPVFIFRLVKFSACELPVTLAYL